MIVEIETDKVVLEVLAQSDGVISKIHKTEGETIASSEIIGEFEESNEPSEIKNTDTQKKSKPKNEEKITEEPQSKKANIDNKKIAPAAKKMILEKNLDSNDINPSGKDNRITKADVINHLSHEEEENSFTESSVSSGGRPEKRVPMSRLRSTIAKRLVSVKQETAMLTTFNEVDMLPIKDLRKKYGAEFENEHEVKLGFMGFFVMAAVQALSLIHI